MNRVSSKRKQEHEPKKKTSQEGESDAASEIKAASNDEVMNSQLVPEKIHKNLYDQGEFSKIVALFREGEATERKEKEEARIEREKERQFEREEREKDRNSKNDFRCCFEVC